MREIWFCLLIVLSLSFFYVRQMVRIGEVA